MKKKVGSCFWRAELREALALARALSAALGLQLAFTLDGGRLRVSLGGFAPVRADPAQD